MDFYTKFKPKIRDFGAVTWRKIVGLKMAGQGWMENLYSEKRQFRGVGGRLGVAFSCILWKVQTYFTAVNKCAIVNACIELVVIISKTRCFMDNLVKS